MLVAVGWLLESRTMCVCVSVGPQAAVLSLHLNRSQTASSCACLARFGLRTFVQLQKQKEAERQAINTLCQASAADLMKVAIINVNSALQMMTPCDAGGADHPGSSPRGSSSWRRRARIVLQIHDELLLEVPKDQLDDVVRVAEVAMVNSAHGIAPGGGGASAAAAENGRAGPPSSHANIIELDVPLAVTFQVGQRWGKMCELATKNIVLSQSPPAPPPTFSNLEESEHQR